MRRGSIYGLLSPECLSLWPRPPLLHLQRRLSQTTSSPLHASSPRPVFRKQRELCSGMLTKSGVTNFDSSSSLTSNFLRFLITILILSRSLSSSTLPGKATRPSSDSPLQHSGPRQGESQVELGKLPLALGKICHFSQLLTSTQTFQELSFLSSIVNLPGRLDGGQFSIRNGTAQSSSFRQI